ncbi:protein of unknown function [Paraburkholderia dioscoreae]|uniref:Uncharacterized protein n=1 Tax=Paraburkholderia dioscoreae TaxID=2604047 RepID=A0A5Q4ZBH8_9BURK|nr:protein of unknown function [Paraburkholderia dioscoreae]
MCGLPKHRTPSGCVKKGNYGRSRQGLGARLAPARGRTVRETTSDTTSDATSDARVHAGCASGETSGEGES